MTVDPYNNRMLWLWQYSAQSEKTAQDVVDSAKNNAGADIIAVKAMDGTEWMATYDQSPEAPNSLQTYEITKQRYKDAGAIFVPWVYTNSPGDVQAHSLLTNDTLIVDAEPYTPGWGTQGGDAFVDYLKGLGNIDVWVSIDPRPAAWEAMEVDKWAHLVDTLLPQCYWTDFNENPWDCLGYVYRCSVAMGNADRVIPILPFDGNDASVPSGNPGNFLQFWRACQGWGCPAPSLWRMGAANLAQLQAFGSLPVS